MAYHLAYESLSRDALDPCLCVQSLDYLDYPDDSFPLFHGRSFLVFLSYLFLPSLCSFLWAFHPLSFFPCLHGDVYVLFCVSFRRSDLVTFVFSRCGSDCGSVYLVTRQLNYIENFVHLKQNMSRLSYLSSLCFFFFLCVSERRGDSSRRPAISCS